MTDYAKVGNRELRGGGTGPMWRRVFALSELPGNELRRKWLLEEYAYSVAWAQKQRDRLLLDGDQCADCGVACAGRIVLRTSWDRLGNEDVEHDLVSVCSRCSAARHGAYSTVRGVRHIGEVIRGLEVPVPANLVTPAIITPQA